MATDQVPAGVSRITKTARVAVHLTSQQQLIADVLWPSPFVDDNYTVLITVEYPNLTTPTIGNATILSFVKKPDHSGISVDVENGDAANPIDVIVHAVAIHD